MSADPNKLPISTVGYFLRIGGGLALLVMMLATGVMAYATYLHDRHRTAFAAEVQAIRDRGEPTDGVELNAYYQIPNDVNDITEFYVNALKPMLDDANRQRLVALKPLCTISVPGSEPPHRPTEWDRLPAAIAALEPYEQMLSDLKLAGQQRGRVRYPHDYSAGLDTQLLYGNALLLSRPLELKLLQHYYQGEFVQATDIVLTGIQLGETFHHDPDFVLQVARLAQLLRTRQWTAFLAADIQFPPEQLQRLQSAFAEVSCEDGFGLSSLGERAVDIDAFQQPINDADFAKDWEVPQGTILAKSYPGQAATRLRRLTENVEISRLPFREAMQAASNQWDELQGDGTQHRLPAWLQSKPHLNFFASAIQRMRWFGKAECEMRAMVVLCAVERFRREKQRLPASLAELVPDFLDALPLDPYMPQQPLSYTTYEDRGYVIYSFGTNFHDGGGDIETEQHGSDFGVRSFARIPEMPQ